MVRVSLLLCAVCACVSTSALADLMIPGLDEEVVASSWTTPAPQCPSPTFFAADQLPWLNDSESYFGLLVLDGEPTGFGSGSAQYSGCVMTVHGAILPAPDLLDPPPLVDRLAGEASALLPPPHTSQLFRPPWLSA